MDKYILRDGIIIIEKNSGIELYDLFRRKKMFVSKINRETFIKCMRIPIKKNFEIMIQTLLSKNYIVKANNKIFSVNYESEFLI